MHKAQDTDWGRTDRTYDQRPMSQGTQSRETARFVHDRGQLTGGRDVKLGPEDELALVRNAGGHIRAPELHPHQGYRDSHRVCPDRGHDGVSCPPPWSGTRRGEGHSRRVPGIQRPSQGGAPRPWSLRGETPQPFRRPPFHCPAGERRAWAGREGRKGPWPRHLCHLPPTPTGPRRKGTTECGTW